MIKQQALHSLPTSVIELLTRIESRKTRTGISSNSMGLMQSMVLFRIPNKSRKQTRRPRRTRRAARNGISMMKTPNHALIPQVSLATVRYSVTYTGGTSPFPLGPQTEVWQFQANSLWNPDNNATLENFPLGHFEWAFLYNRYQVISSTIRVTAHCTSTGTFDDATQILIWAKPYSNQFPTGATNLDSFVGQTDATAPRIVGTCIGNSTLTMSSTKTTSHMLGRPDSQLFCNPDVSGYCVNSSLQPSSTWYWNVVTQADNLNGLPAPAPISYRFTVEYRVRYHQPHGFILRNHAVTGVATGPNDDTEPNCCDAKEDEQMHTSIPQPLRELALSQGTSETPAFRKRSQSNHALS